MKAVMTAAFLTLPLLAVAAESSRPGDETRALLEFQRSGSAASKAERPMNGEVADKVYQRYVDSFGHPIPQKFSREDFGSGSGGGSSGSGEKSQ